MASTEYVSSFTSHVHESHEVISDKLAQNNANHEMRVDDTNRLKTFNVGNIVKQLHICSANPFQILMKLHDNVYAINLFINVDIGSTFNIEYLVDYKSLDVFSLVDESSHEPIFESLFLSPLPYILPYTTCQVDKFLDDKNITIQDGGIRKYLIC